jgi:hypothetical protein
VVVDQVELDLQACHRPAELEARLAQHPLEDVEASAHLLPVPRPVRPAELRRCDLLAHATSSPAITGLDDHRAGALLRISGETYRSTATFAQRSPAP